MLLYYLIFSEVLARIATGYVGGQPGRYRISCPTLLNRQRTLLSRLISFAAERVFDYKH